VNALRAAVLAGLAGLAPLACWLLLEARVAPLPALAPAALAALLLGQASVLALWIPLLPDAAAGERVAASALLAMIPAPLSALLWLSGAVAAATLLRAQLALLALALVTSALARLVQRAPRGAPLLRASLQVLLMSLLWRFQPRWLEPLLA
jgi:hypothetical protein